MYLGQGRYDVKLGAAKDSQDMIRAQARERVMQKYDAAASARALRLQIPAHKKPHHPGTALKVRTFRPPGSYTCTHAQPLAMASLARWLLAPARQPRVTTLCQRMTGSMPCGVTASDIVPVISRRDLVHTHKERRNSAAERA